MAQISDHGHANHAASFGVRCARIVRQGSLWRQAVHLTRKVRALCDFQVFAFLHHATHLVPGTEGFSWQQPPQGSSRFEQQEKPVDFVSSSWLAFVHWSSKFGSMFQVL